MWLEPGALDKSFFLEIWIHRKPEELDNITSRKLDVFPASGILHRLEVPDSQSYPAAKRSCAEPPQVHSIGTSESKWARGQDSAGVTTGLHRGKCGVASLASN